MLHKGLLTSWTKRRAGTC